MNFILEHDPDWIGIAGGEVTNAHLTTQMAFQRRVHHGSKQRNETSNRTFFQERGNEWVSTASEPANGRASRPVLRSQFLPVLNHWEVFRDGHGPTRRRGRGLSDAIYSLSIEYLFIVLIRHEIGAYSASFRRWKLERSCLTVCYVFFILLTCWGNLNCDTSLPLRHSCHSVPLFATLCPYLASLISILPILTFCHFVSFPHAWPMTNVLQHHTIHFLPLFLVSVYQSMPLFANFARILSNSSLILVTVCRSSSYLAICYSSFLVSSLSFAPKTNKRNSPIRLFQPHFDKLHDSGGSSLYIV